jgi:hypothetical protein
MGNVLSTACEIFLVPLTPNFTAAAAVVAEQLGVVEVSVRRWVMESQVDDGKGAGATSEELAEINREPQPAAERPKTWGASEAGRGMTLPARPCVLLASGIS